MQNNLSSKSSGAMCGLLHTGLILAFLIFAASSRLAFAAVLHNSRAVCNVRSYGAHGDGSALDTQALNSAISDCHSKGGGVVEVTPGLYLSGTIYFMDNVTVNVQEGATILASSNLADYPHMAHASEWRDTSLFVAENVSHIALTGKGKIDGNGRAFISAQQVRWTPSFDITKTRQGQAWSDRMALANEGPLTMSLRPGVLFVALHVNGLKIEDIHVVDSPNWTIKVGCSEHIRVNRLDVRNDMRIPNNDALDISTSSDALVENSYLQAGDDALVIGGPCLDGWCQGPTEHIRVKNVTLLSRSAAIRVGPSAKGVHDVKVSHVVILDSNRGILIHTRTNETLEDISFSDIVINTHLIDGPWWGAGEPISIGVALSDYVSWPKVTTLGFVRHVRFSHIVTNSDSPLVFYSMEPGHIQDIGFDHLSVTMVPDALNTILGGNLDLQPTTPVNFGVQKHDLPAILVHNVDGLQLNKVQVHWSGPFPAYYTNALSAEGFTDLSINGFVGAASVSTLPAIALHSGSGAKIRHARSTAGPLLDDSNGK